MKTYRDDGSIAPPFLSSTPHHDTEYIGGFMGPTAGLDGAENRKISYFGQKSNPSSSVAQPIV
jgi:hypothetical protein